MYYCSSRSKVYASSITVVVRSWSLPRSFHLGCIFNMRANTHLPCFSCTEQPDIGPHITITQPVSASLVRLCTIEVIILHTHFQAVGDTKMQRDMEEKSPSIASRIALASLLFPGKGQPSVFA